MRRGKEKCVFTGEQEETQEMEKEIYDKDNNSNLYKRNGERLRENSGISRKKIN
jgi:hypothetical protein